jgi:hypothetical protein
MAPTGMAMPYPATAPASRAAIIETLYGWLVDRVNVEHWHRDDKGPARPHHCCVVAAIGHGSWTSRHD